MISSELEGETAERNTRWPIEIGEAEEVFKSLAYYRGCKEMLIRRYFVALISLAVLAIIIAAWSYLFRTEKEENPYLGEIALKHRWGRVHTFSADKNMDGITNSLAIWPDYDRNLPPLEAWYDPEDRGSFKYHVVYDEGKADRLEIDEDGDGIYESVLHGKDAQSYIDTNLCSRIPDHGK